MQNIMPARQHRLQRREPPAHLPHSPALLAAAAGRASLPPWRAGQPEGPPLAAGGRDGWNHMATRCQGGGAAAMLLPGALVDKLGDEMWAGPFCVSPFLSTPSVLPSPLLSLCPCPAVLELVLAGSNDARSWP